MLSKLVAIYTFLGLVSGFQMASCGGLPQAMALIAQLTATQETLVASFHAMQAHLNDMESQLKAQCCPSFSTTGTTGSTGTSSSGSSGTTSTSGTTGTTGTTGTGAVLVANQTADFSFQQDLHGWGYGWRDISRPEGDRPYKMTLFGDQCIHSNLSWCSEYDSYGHIDRWGFQAHPHPLSKPFPVLCPGSPYAMHADVCRTWQTAATGLLRIDLSYEAEICADVKVSLMIELIGNGGITMWRETVTSPYGFYTDIFYAHAGDMIVLSTSTDSCECSYVKTTFDIYQV